MNKLTFTLLIVGMFAAGKSAFRLLKVFKKQSNKIGLRRHAPNFPGVWPQESLLP